MTFLDPRFFAGTTGDASLPPRRHRLQLRQLRPCRGALAPPHACGAGDGGATYGGPVSEKGRRSLLVDG